MKPVTLVLSAALLASGLLAPATPALADRDGWSRSYRLEERKPRWSPWHGAASQRWRGPGQRWNRSPHLRYFGWHGNRWRRDPWRDPWIAGDTRWLPGIGLRDQHRPWRQPGAIVSCYRVERLPGGRERRILLPDRACR